MRETFFFCSPGFSTQLNMFLDFWTEMRPAEVYFQMHILARESEDRLEAASGIENCQTPEKWVLRAIHTNPSCMRYWNVLDKLDQQLPIS